MVDEKENKIEENKELIENVQEETIIETEIPKEHEFHVHTEIPEAILETFGNNSITTLGEPEKKKSKLGIIILLLLLLILAGVATFYFLNYR